MARLPIALVVAITLAVVLPAGAARQHDVTSAIPMSASPDDEHRLAEALCRSGEPAGMLVGAAAAIGVVAAPVPRVPVDADLAAAVLALYAFTPGVVLTPELREAVARDAAPVPGAVAGPVAVLALAMAEAAALNERALAPLTPEDRAVLRALVGRGGADDLAPRELAAGAKIEKRFQVAAALLLLAAVDAVTPAIRAAVDAGQWPKSEPIIADPVGLIRIGSTGNDVETRPRMLLVDPAGNDVYFGRLAGAIGLGILQFHTAVALAIDLAGDDEYRVTTAFTGGHLGAGQIGVGVFADAVGDDIYESGQVESKGYGLGGVGVFVELSGSDDYADPGESGGRGGVGIGLAVDIAGDDDYVARSFSYGAASAPPSVGFFCDREGEDTHFTTYSQSFGYASGASTTKGWFADVGGALDVYSGSNGTPAGDASYWTNGFTGGIGRGLDV